MRTGGCWPSGRFKKGGGFLCERVTRRYEFVRVHRREWPVSWICLVMRVSVSGFHAWFRRGVSAKRISDHRLSVLIREAHERAHRRIHQVLVRNGLAIGRNAVARVMRREKIRPWYHRKWRKSPVDSPECPAAPNRLNRKFIPGEPDRAWLADMTEVRTPDGKLYLATVEDIGSRKIVGHAMANRMTAELPLRALRKALLARGARSGCWPIPIREASSGAGCTKVNSAAMESAAACRGGPTAMTIHRWSRSTPRSRGSWISGHARPGNRWSWKSSSSSRSTITESAFIHRSGT